jgi:O-antigen ligase
VRPGAANSYARGRDRIEVGVKPRGVELIARRDGARKPSRVMLADGRDVVVDERALRTQAVGSRILVGVSVRVTSLRGPMLLGLALILALLTAIAVEAAYRYSPAIGAGVVIAPAFLALVAWRPTYGIYAALLLIPLEASSAAVGSSSITPSKAIFGLTAACVLPRLLLGSSRRRLHAAHLWFIALLPISVTGLAFAPDTHAVLVLTGNAFAFLLISIYVSQMDRVEIDRLLFVLVLSGGIVGLVTVVTTGPQTVVPGGVDISGRAALGFANPNILAFYLLLTVGPGLAMIVEPTRRWQRLMSLGATPLIIAALVLTLSRAAIVGALIIPVVLLGSSRFRRLAVGLAAVLILVVAFNFGDIMNSREVVVLQQRLGTISSVSGVQQNPRVVIWKTTPRIIADHYWLGVGEGNFQMYTPRYGLFAFDGTPINHAHDMFLTVAAELGLVGFAVFLGFLIALARAAYRVIRRNRSQATLSLGVIGALGGVLFTSLGEYPPRTEVILATILIVVGVLIAFDRFSAEPDAPAARQNSIEP